MVIGIGLWVLGMELNFMFILMDQKREQVQVGQTPLLMLQQTMLGLVVLTNRGQTYIFGLETLTKYL
jgi:hypothetical protein